MVCIEMTIILLKSIFIDPMPRTTKGLEILSKGESMRIAEREYGNKDVTDCNYFIQILNI